MSAPGEAKQSLGPKGTAARESGRPTRQGSGGLALRFKEAER